MLDIASIVFFGARGIAIAVFPPEYNPLITADIRSLNAYLVASCALLAVSGIGDGRAS